MNLKKPLIILEMANNHMGNVNHGIDIIRDFSILVKKYECFDFAFKFQYRNLDTFIHQDYKSRTDLHYVKRFNDTRISENDFTKMRQACREFGFKTMCTPFDNESVERIVKEGYDYIKVASCSCSDWPLLEEVSKTGMPIVASLGGALEKDIDKLYKFFMHRGNTFSVMHCTPVYPTPIAESHLSQIIYLKDRYEGVPVGFSTHEPPEDYLNGALAFAMGAQLFEKHVGKVTSDYALNKYSATCEQVDRWCESIKDSMERVGPSDGRVSVSDDLLTSLKSLQRGVFCKNDVKSGEEITEQDIYYAFPPAEGQLRASDISMFNSITAESGMTSDQAVMIDNYKIESKLSSIDRYLEEVKEFVKKSGVILPKRFEAELSHHYGLERFMEYGLTLIDIVNRDYCKKVLVTLPNQVHPEQYHKVKEETFIILYGELELQLNGELRLLKAGDMVTVEPLVKHRFTSKTGAVIEEISTTHVAGDSYYVDESIHENKNRKTRISDWL